METMSVRIPSEELEEIDKISREKGMKRSDVLREVLRAGIREKKLEIALDKYINYEVTAWKAARLADIPLTKFLEILKSRNMEIHYTEEEVEEEFSL